ncbi:MAG: alpha/beta hydrolase [Chloroflexi bacterium]|nr:alpha/beta hydrolase [Chloroflexota bacterium]
MIAVVRGVRINYDVVGAEGPWIMLIQGGRQDMELFRPLAENLAKAGYRVLLHDRRNSGGSEVSFEGEGAEDEIFADDAHELCAQLGALPVIACGGAGGSRHCILMTLRHPGSTRCLLLWWPSGGRPAAEQLAELYYGQYAAAAQKGGMQAVLETPFYAERCSRVPENRAKLLQTDVHQFIETMRKWQRFFLDGADLPVIGVERATVAGIHLPACIIHGHDMIHPQHIAEELAEILPNAELHWVPPMPRPEDETGRRQARLDHQQRLADIFSDFLGRTVSYTPQSD